MARLPSFLCVFALTLSSTSAQIVINEFSAASSERQVRHDEHDRPRIGWGPGWMDLEFDASHWKSGDQPFGFGHSDLETDLRSDMRRITPSLYLRKTFTVSAEDARRGEPLRFDAKFDDGIVVYVNGVEVGRGNLGARNGIVYHDQSSFTEQDRATRTFKFEGPLANEVLEEGENVLAIQVHNRVIQHINENETNEYDDTLRFEGNLYIGLGLFAGGSNIRLAQENRTFQYFVGLTEPSGGLADIGLLSAHGSMGGFSDWIELANTSDTDVDISGWTLTDDPDSPTAWTFPDNTSIPANGFLIVMADGMESAGTAGDYLHTSFKLSADGEYIGLFDASGTVVDELPEDFPNQNAFHSYGRHDSGEFVYFANPTPGNANDTNTLAAIVKAPKFSVSGGFYDDDVELMLESATDGAVIRFTTDGSEPQQWNGDIANGPITIAAIDDKTGTVIRARAFKEGMVPSKVKTHTYLIAQDPALQSVPALSFAADGGRTFYKPHGVMAVEGGSGLGDAWTSTGVDDYYMPQMHGRAYERPTSMEIIYPDGSGEDARIQADVGFRLAASAWSRPRFRLQRTHQSPWESNAGEKPSFNVFFRNDYGEPELDFPFVKNYPVRSFDQLRLRAGKNDIRNPWIKDELARRLFADTGQLGSVGIQNAMYVNGEYKGYFNTVARLRKGLFQEFYGREAPWDIRHIGSWTEGDDTFYEELIRMLEKNLTNLTNWQEALSMIDPINVADYLIVNTYGATWDWPHNNFVIARERSEQGRWRMYMWDAEGTFGHSDHNVDRNVIETDIIKNSSRANAPIVRISRLMLDAPEFRLLFADRLQKHFFTPEGILTQDHITNRMEELREEISALMRFTGNGNLNTSGMRSWISRREDVLFKRGQHFRNSGLWPETQVANFTPKGGAIAPGANVKLNAGSIFDPQGGDILYTLDGSDPRLMGGEVSDSARVYDKSTPIVLNQSTTIQVRVRDGNSWSPINEATFLIDSALATSESLVISEIMYDPLATTEEESAAGHSKSDFEYIELFNASGVTIDLSGVSFVEGIRFDFRSADQTTLRPGAYLVLVADRDAFTMRYGTGIPIGGEYGRNLNNDGEVLEIANAAFQTLKRFEYGDRDPWPEETDGEGYSLELTNPNDNPDPADPAHWTVAEDPGGSPGAPIGESVSNGEKPLTYAIWRTREFDAEDTSNDLVSGPNADPDGDSRTNLMEYATGTKPKDRLSHDQFDVQLETLEIDGVSNTYATFTTSQALDLAGVTVAIESSSNLRDWSDTEEFVQHSKVIENGIERITYRSGRIQADYVRLRYSLAP